MLYALVVFLILISVFLADRIRRINTKLDQKNEEAVNTENLFQDIIADRDLEIDTLQGICDTLVRQVDKRDKLNRELRQLSESVQKDLDDALSNLKMVLEGPIWTPNISFENYEPEWLAERTEGEHVDPGGDFAEQIRRENYEAFMDEIYIPDNVITKNKD